MASRKTELLVVGGLVLGLGVVALRDVVPGAGARSARQRAGDLMQRGEMVTAERAAKTCDAVDGGVLDPDAHLRCMAQLIILEHANGNLVLARQHLASTVGESMREAPNVTPDTLAEVFLASSKIRGEDEHGEAVADAQRALDLATQKDVLARANLQLGALLRPGAEAEPYLRRALALNEELGNGANIALAEAQLGMFLASRDPAQAVRAFESSIARYAGLVEGGHPLGVSPLFGLASLRLDQKDPAGALAPLETGIALARRGFGPDSPYLLQQLCLKGRALHRLQRTDEARGALEEGLALAARSGQRDEVCRTEFAMLAMEEQQPDRARAILERLVALIEADPDSPERTKTLAELRRNLERLEAPAGH
jgi:tetratricopeptide (TPR) repeat protein